MMIYRAIPGLTQRNGSQYGERKMRKMKSTHPVLKVLVVVALILTSLVGLMGKLAIARAAVKANYNVIAGPELTYGVSVLGFSPQTLKVHRGDTVTWQQ